MITRPQHGCRGSQRGHSSTFTLARDLLDKASAEHGANDDVAGRRGQRSKFNSMSRVRRSALKRGAGRGRQAVGSSLGVHRRDPRADPTIGSYEARPRGAGSIGGEGTVIDGAPDAFALRVGEGKQENSDVAPQRSPAVPLQARPSSRVRESDLQSSTGRVFAGHQRH